MGVGVEVEMGSVEEDVGSIKTSRPFPLSILERVGRPQSVGHGSGSSPSLLSPLLVVGRSTLSADGLLTSTGSGKSAASWSVRSGVGSC